eukprot:768750-Hanusia_phi.AAC.6
MYLPRESENLEGKVWNISPIIKDGERSSGSTGQFIKKFNKRASDVNALRTLPLVSSKTAFTRKFEEFLDVDIWYGAIARGHYCKRRCGRVRLIITLARCVVSKNSSTVYGSRAYGNASFASTGRGDKAVPVKWIKRECQKRYSTVDVDEFRTTKCCSFCPILSTVRRRQVSYGTERTVRVRGLKLCESHQACCSRSRFVFRDAKAALNIMACFENTKRPEFLRRPTG